MHRVKKSQTNVTNVSMHPIKQAVWGITWSDSLDPRKHHPEDKDDDDGDGDGDAYENEDDDDGDDSGIDDGSIDDGQPEFHFSSVPMKSDHDGRFNDTKMTFMMMNVRMMMIHWTIGPWRCLGIPLSYPSQRFGHCTVQDIVQNTVQNIVQNTVQNTVQDIVQDIVQNTV